MGVSPKLRDLWLGKPFLMGAIGVQVFGFRALLPFEMRYGDAVRDM